RLNACADRFPPVLGQKRMDQGNARRPPGTRGALMRVWLVQGKPGDETAGLDVLLRQWVQQSAGAIQVERCLLGPNLAAEVQLRRPDVLVVAEPSCPAGPWTAAVLAAGVGLVAATNAAGAEGYRALAEQHPVSLASLSPGVEGLGLALLSAHAAARRQHS